MDLEGNDILKKGCMKTKIHHRWLVVSGCLALAAVVLSFSVRCALFFPADLYLAQQLQTLHNPLFRQIMQGITFWFGDWRVLILVAVALPIVWWRLGRREGIMLLIAALVININHLLKLAIQRPRPTPDLMQVLANESGWSFPSGHTFTAVMLLGMLAYLVATRCRKGILRTLLIIGLLILMLLVGISRVYLGVHWPSDILGACLWGGFFLSLLIYCFPRVMPTADR
jgi:undecaprenyl-diphosphatase